MHTETYNKAYIIGISFISALGGYLFGFDFAVISGALPFLQKQFGLDSYWEGFATGVLALGAMAGCLLAGSISDRLGRKRGLLVAAALFFISALCMAFSTDKVSLSHQDAWPGLAWEWPQCFHQCTSPKLRLRPFVDVWLRSTSLLSSSESFFVYLKVKETKGKTLEELEAVFSH